MDQLSNKKCVPCEGGATPLSVDELPPYLEQVPQWQLIDSNTKIQREFEFKNFEGALKFVNDVGAIAQEEDHHPNILLHDYKNVIITLYTHNISGLHENDFIVAAKIDELFRDT